MNIERFHNELAMRLGYERIVNDKHIHISVEESDDPVVTLKVQGCEDIRYKASNETIIGVLENQKEIKDITDAAHLAYIKANKNQFSELNNKIFTRND